jgi:hypothetical protein
MSARGRGKRSVPTPSAPAGAALPRALPRGLLIVQGANLEDAAAELARIDGRMAGGQSDALAGRSLYARAPEASSAGGERPSAVAQPPAGRQLVSAPAPAWEVSLRWRPPGSARARVMGRVRFQAPDAARAREAAATALAARAGGEGRWSLGVLRALTANAPGTHAYVVTFAAWESRGERFVRRDVHEREVWATDATSARRLASEQVQAMPSYLPAWRVSRVAPRGDSTPAARGTRVGSPAAGRRGDRRRAAPSKASA